MSVDEFVAKYNGVHIDEDGYYGAQCWDVSARYAREVVGCPSFPTGSGGAEGLFRLFQNPIPQYFDRIANNKNDPNQLPQKGDVIVWDGSFSPPWGHTAVVISADSSGPTVLEQNGNNPGGVAYIKKRGWTGVSGWLRPKKGLSDMITNNDLGPVRIVMSEVEGWNGHEIHTGKYDGTIMTAWVGHTWQEFLNHCWTVQNTHRVHLTDAIDGLNNQVAQLSQRPTQDVVDSLNTKVDELVKVTTIKDGEVKRLTEENAALQAKAGDVNLSVKQAIKILWQTVLDAVKN